jgi:hypothetical protein
MNGSHESASGADAQPFTLIAAQGRPRHLPVVGPRRIEEPRRDLDLLVDRHDVPFPHHRPIGHRGRLAIVERPGKHRRVLAFILENDVARRRVVSVQVPVLSLLVILQCLARHRLWLLGSRRSPIPEQRNRRTHSADHRATRADPQKLPSIEARFRDAHEDLEHVVSSANKLRVSRSYFYV